MKRLMHFMNLKPKKLRLQENRRQQNSTKCIKTALGVNNAAINIKQKTVGVHQNMRGGSKQCSDAFQSLILSQPGGQQL